MVTTQFDFHLSAGADWQKVVRLRDYTTNKLVPLSSALMEIRNVNGVLALRLDAPSSRCYIDTDGSSIRLHIPAQDSYVYFRSGNYPGAVQAVGIWGIGRAYVFDLFVTYDPSGTQDRIMRGWFYVDPNITQPLDPNLNYELTVAQRGSWPQ
jgi:hypothetical protein